MTLQSGNNGGSEGHSDSSNANMELKGDEGSFSYATMVYCFRKDTNGTCKIDRLINIITIDDLYLRCDCVDEIIVSGTTKSNFHTFALDRSPVHKILKSTKVK